MPQCVDCHQPFELCECPALPEEGDLAQPEAA